MFDFITRLFGEGKIRFKAHLENGDAIIGKMSYIGDLSTFDDDDRAQLAKRVEVEFGKKVQRIEVLAAY